MIKRMFFFIIIISFSWSCDTENAIDCFQRTGDIVREEIAVPDFTRILVNPNVEVILKEGDLTSVIIETGDNLLEEVSAVVEGDRLILSNTNDCNFVRSFNQTKIFITAPNITEIRSATQFDISSDGVLSYPSLILISEDFNEDTGNSTGSFILDVQIDNITVVINNIAFFDLEGNVENLNVRFFGGIGRFDGTNLLAEHVEVFHRGANKIIVNPQQSLIGEIRSTGDVISVNRPPIVEVEEFFTGRLLFE